MALGVVLFLAVSLLAGIDKDYPNSQDAVVQVYFDPWTMCDVEPIPEYGNSSIYNAPLALDEIMLTEPGMLATLGWYVAEASKRIAITMAEMRVMLDSLVAEVAAINWHDVYNWMKNTLTGMMAAFKEMGPAERSFWTVSLLIVIFIFVERKSIIGIFTSQISEVVALRFSPHLSKDFVTADDIIKAMSAKAMLTEARHCCFVPEF